MTEAQYFDAIASLTPQDQERIFGTVVDPKDVTIIKAGFNSIGGCVVGSDGPVFVKFTPVGSREQGKELVSAAKKDFTSIPPVHAIHVLFEGQQKSPVLVQRAAELSSLEDIFAVLTISELVDARFVPLVDLMRSHGITTIQTAGASVDSSWFDFEALQALYQDIVTEMMEIHQLPVDRMTLPGRKEAYKEGIQHVITSSERFDTIAGFVDGIPHAAEVIKPQDISFLRTEMQRLVHEYAQHAHTRIVPIHGDLWMANRLVAQDEQGDIKSRLIDPAPVEYGDRGYDVTFALADLVFTQAQRTHGSTFVGEYTDVAESLLQRYAKESGDTDIRKYMALFFMYKAFVAALFDAGENQVLREKLLSAAHGVAVLSREKDFQFSWQMLDTYASYGKTI